MPPLKSLGSRAWRSRRIHWRLVRVGSALVVGIAALLVLIMIFEEQFIYFPSKYPAGWWDVADAVSAEGLGGPKIDDVELRTSDGVALHGWYCAPVRRDDETLQPVPAPFVILWFHGNAGNITHRYEGISSLVTLPADVFIIDYRGYGKSEGTPSETGLYRDADAAWSYLTETRGVSPGQIVLLGKSLGAAVAIDLATRVHPGALIVESGFTSAPDMARRILPLVPTFALRTRMDSISKIGRVSCPVLFIHSRDDEVIPFGLGRRLYEAAGEPKRFHELRGLGHNDLYPQAGQGYLEAIGDFLQSLTTSGEGPGASSPTEQAPPGLP